MNDKRYFEGNTVTHIVREGAYHGPPGRRPMGLPALCGINSYTHPVTNEAPNIARGDLRLCGTCRTLYDGGAR